MTTPSSPQGDNLLLILGEMRGDLKAVVAGLSKMEAQISSVETKAHERASSLEKRVASLEAIRMKIGTLAVFIAILLTAVRPELLKIVTLIFGG